MAGVPIVWPALAGPAIIFGLILVVIGIVVVFAPRRDGAPRLRWVPMWELRISGWPPFQRMISLQDASLRASELLRGTAYDAMSRTALVEGDRLGYFATALGDEGRTALWGTEPPSRVFVPIPREEWPRYIIEGAGAVMRRTGEKASRYENLHIRRIDFVRRVKEMRGRAQVRLGSSRD